MFDHSQFSGTYGYPPPVDVMGRPMACQMPQGGNTQYPVSRTQRSGFICVPVTSREEAVATRVEAFGPAIIMPDLGHGMVYYKRFNEKTALADFGEFRYVSPEPDTQANGELSGAGISSPAVFSDFKNQLDAISARLDQLVQQIAPSDAGKREEKGGSKK